MLGLRLAQGKMGQEVATAAGTPATASFTSLTGGLNPGGGTIDAIAQSPESVTITGTVKLPSKPGVAGVIASYGTIDSGQDAEATEGVVVLATFLNAVLAGADVYAILVSKGASSGFLVVPYPGDGVEITFGCSVNLKTRAISWASHDSVNGTSRQSGTIAAALQNEIIGSPNRHNQQSSMAYMHKGFNGATIDIAQLSIEPGRYVDFSQAKNWMHMGREDGSFRYMGPIFC